jgi:hypothetical protein
MLADAVLVILQLYFILMNLTVESYYCHSGGKLTVDDKRFLIPETITFCTENNPLFLAAPDWMVNATCVSAYVFFGCYVTILLVTGLNQWRRFAIPLLLFIGAKMNAIGFYHLMEFTHPTLAPQNILAYFSVEGPYLLSMTIVLWKVTLALSEKQPSLPNKKLS